MHLVAPAVGGTGKFLGATGYTEVDKMVFANGTVAVKQGTYTIHAWVPRNLPRPAGSRR